MKKERFLLPVEHGFLIFIRNDKTGRNDRRPSYNLGTVHGGTVPKFLEYITQGTLRSLCSSKLERCSFLFLAIFVQSPALNYVVIINKR
jgi:hypothetical protein